MRWRGAPVFGLALIALAALMAAPAALAFAEGDARGASAFGYSALVTLAAGFLLSLAMRRRADGREAPASGEFLTLLAILALCPLAAAAPVAAAAPALAFEAAYFEMVSMITTTGATVFDRLGETSGAIRLWRVLVAGFGGFIALVMAWALLAPRSLGGFEVRGDQGRSAAIGRLAGDPVWAGGRPVEAAGDRLSAAIRSVAPVYAGLIAALSLIFSALGHAPMQAFAGAVGLMSTSGVRVTDGPAFATSGFAGEAVAAVALILAVTRHTYGGTGRPPFEFGAMRTDPELRLLAAVVLTVTIWFHLRHWLGALDLAAGAEQGDAFRAFWGALFTTLSFATTTGYHSADWEAARAWSGLGNPALILLGLAIMGGGVATTAGGVKLLRAYALYRHGARELERLVRPSSIQGAKEGRRGLRREGAQIAWVFVMLFIIALAFAMLGVSLTGLAFEPGLAASVAAITNTGPLFPTMTGGSWLTSLKPEARGVLVVAMIVGRVEILALIAMMNAESWR